MSETIDEEEKYHESACMAIPWKEGILCLVSRAAFDDDNIGDGEVWISFVLHLLGLLYDGPVNPIPIAENY
jgi:hypothetical protein